MKALHVLGGGAWGGGSVVVLAITKAMIARGDQVSVIALDDETARRFREAGAVPVRLPLWFRPISPLDIIPLVALWLLCLRRRYDLVLTHTSKGGMLGRLAARLAGVPAIVHYVHGFAFHEFTQPLVKPFFVALERLAARFCDAIISVGEAHRQTAIRLGIKKPECIHTVLNGIDLRRFLNVDRARARRSLGFGDDEIILGSNGRLSAQKGFEYMIRALPEIVARFPRVRLAIAGVGPREEELRTLAAEMDIADRVTFLGFRRDVPELLAAMDVFVHSSLWEGLSISLMEAMAAGRPIVATRICGNLEMIESGRNGILAEPASPEALASAVCRVLEDDFYARSLAAEARRDALRRFTEERMVDQNLAVYDSLDRKSTRLNSSHSRASRMPSSA